MGNFCKAENGILRFFEAEIGIHMETETRKITKAEIRNKYLSSLKPGGKAEIATLGNAPSIRTLVWRLLLIFHGM